MLRRQAAAAAAAECLARNGAHAAYAWHPGRTVNRVFQSPGRRLHVQQSCGGCHGDWAVLAGCAAVYAIATCLRAQSATQTRPMALLPMQTLLSSQPARSVIEQCRCPLAQPSRPIAQHAEERKRVCVREGRSTACCRPLLVPAANYTSWQSKGEH